jgi:hypothetical protein
MNDAKYIGLDVHQATISATVLDSAGKLVMESILETKAATILQFMHGLRGDLQVTFEEGTCAAWLHDLLKPHVRQVLVCDPRKNALLKVGNKSDRIDARKLAELLRSNLLRSVYHQDHGIRTVKELARSYMTITRDLTRVLVRIKALYRSRAIPCAGQQVYAARHRAEWLGKIGRSWGAPPGRVLLPTVRRSAALAPASTARVASREQQAPGQQIAAADSFDRTDSCGPVAGTDPNAASLSHQTPAVELQRPGARNPQQRGIPHGAWPVPAFQENSGHSRPQQKS